MGETQVLRTREKATRRTQIRRSAVARRRVASAVTKPIDAMGGTWRKLGGAGGRGGKGGGTGERRCPARETDNRNCRVCTRTTGGRTW